MAEIHGNVEPRLQILGDLLSASLDAGTDLGASVAVTVDGEFVADLWGGWADEARTKPWGSDTIVNVWSTTKTMTSLAALALVARGQLDVHAPVAQYWPEFAANGKERVKVRHLMSHTSGVSGWAQPITTEDLYDWERSTAMLAAQPPWWEPGTASGYHALNQGHLVGEVVRRITGLKLGEFFAKEIAAPLGADFFIGLPASEDHRVSPVIPPPPIDTSALGAIDPGSVAVKTLTGPPISAIAANTEGWRRADIGAANGHGNARSVARLQSVVACGGTVGGVELLDAQTCALIFEEQSNGVDLAIGVPCRFGIGYGLGAMLPYLPSGRICFWCGYGGSMIIVDLDRRMTIAYVMNRMESGTTGDFRGEGLIRAVYDVVG